MHAPQVWPDQVEYAKGIAEKLAPQVWIDQVEYGSAQLKRIARPEQYITKSYTNLRTRLV